MKISAIIILYYPNHEDLFKNISSCIESVDKLIIWDNTPDIDASHNYDFIKKFGQNILYLTEGKNIGIAAGLNRAIGWSVKNGFSHILTLDQDSSFENGHLASFCEIIEQVKRKDIGVYSPNIRSRGKLEFSQTTDYLEVTDAITSGSIIPLILFKEVGLFEEDLFIDAVDYEFCYRIFRLGYKTIIIPKIVLNQTYGYRTKTAWGFHTLNYSPERTYFIVRNHITIWRKYPDLFPFRYKRKLIKKYIFERIIKIILAEKDKQKKIKAIVIGITDGLKGKLGNIRSF